MKSLIVEDDVTSRTLMKNLLAPFGECNTAQDGIEAIVLHRMGVCEKKPYDLIILDLNLPEVDGLLVLRKIRWYEELTCLPEVDKVKIIVTTSQSDKASVQKAIQLQCNNYMLKPIDRFKLMTHLRSYGFMKETT